MERAGKAERREQINKHVDETKSNVRRSAMKSKYYMKLIYKIQIFIINVHPKCYNMRRLVLDQVEETSRSRHIRRKI